MSYIPVINITKWLKNSMKSSPSKTTNFIYELMITQQTNTKIANISKKLP